MSYKEKLRFVLTPEVGDDFCVLVGTENGGFDVFKATPFSGDFYDLLVHLEVFPSKGQAKKNFKGPLPGKGKTNYPSVGKKKYNLDIHIVGDQ